MKPVWMALLGVLALAGCDRKAAPPVPAATASATAAVSGPERRIVALGDSLFAGYGLRPAEAYLELGQPITFYTVTEACRRRGEVAMGYVRKREQTADDPRNMGGVVVNPKKSEALTYEAGDRIIVLARD